VSLHNVWFLLRVAEARTAILAGDFERWSSAWLRGYSGRRPMNALLPAIAPRGSGTPSWFFLLQIGLMIGIFWFLLIRPQSQARKRHAAILAALKKGDDITTAGGIIGKVKDIKDDRITIESGTATFIVERGRIVRVGESVSPQT
jgi:preprotein translocase subunit YajC